MTIEQIDWNGDDDGDHIFNYDNALTLHELIEKYKTWGSSGELMIDGYKHHCWYTGPDGGMHIYFKCSACSREVSITDK